MRWYLDSSIALHAILPSGDVRAQAWCQSALSSGNQVTASSLLRLEVMRVLHREGLQKAEADWLLRRVHSLHITQSILTIAESIDRHVRSLDAIHLATAVHDGGQLTMVTHDSTMGEVAEHLGLETFDPLT